MDRLQATLWGFPAAFGVHVAEEAAGGFTEWAQRKASPRYTERDFVRDNALGFAMTLAATALAMRPGRRGFRLHYALVLTQQAPSNAVFHAATRAPGRLTAIAVVLPLWVRITRLARRERLLSRRDVAVALALGGAVHGAAVAQQVYFVRPPRRADEGGWSSLRSRSDRAKPAGVGVEGIVKAPPSPPRSKPGSRSAQLLCSSIPASRSRLSVLCPSNGRASPRASSTPLARPAAHWASPSSVPCSRSASATL